MRQAATPVRRLGQRLPDLRRLARKGLIRRVEGKPY
jgi:hypothetical protein